MIQSNHVMVLLSGRTHKVLGNKVYNVIAYFSFTSFSRRRIPNNNKLITNLIDQLKRDEGLRLIAYPDPITNKEPYTIGYGHTGGILPTDTWTIEKSESMLLEDIQNATNNLVNNLKWVLELDEVRRSVLINMVFNMGWYKVSKFHNTLYNIYIKEYKLASQQLLQSLWSKQVGDRAVRLSKQLETGIWQ